MRRVMHVTTAHPVSDNRILRKECTALAQAGFDVILVAVHDRDEVLHGIPVLGLPRHRGRLSRMVLGPVAAWRRLSARRPDVVHGHDPELIPLLLLYRLVHPGCRVIYDAHEDLPQQVAGKPYLPRLVRPVVARAARALEGLADRGLDAVVVATPHIGRRHELARTVLVQNYPWLSDFPEPEPYPTDASPVVCYAGGISAGRGYEAMCALPRLVTRPLEVVLAGPCAEEVAGRPLPEGVTHLGTLAPDEVPPLLARSAAGLAVLLPLPNYLESQPTKVYEYLAAGRPFVASDFPYWVETFGPHRCGLFVDATDPRAVARAVELLLSDPEEAAAMGARGRQAVVEHFSFENEAARLCALVTDLVGR
ncbi:glycosyltransferase [Arsenicicoccus dermatophilus]|uniref:glycosyltransferase n=1 Tax=Arsenicicoccus dermatophilus TaxID=1076331 RepID=UPI001F4CC50C|nr:glycosyltransferase [Arsenicicoccus dermatophilus]MCH8613719.1 glycosyltransferase [Arsenicicoccus dermatophilus]